MKFKKKVFIQAGKRRGRWQWILYYMFVTPKKKRFKYNNMWVLEYAGRLELVQYRFLKVKLRRLPLLTAFTCFLTRANSVWYPCIFVLNCFGLRITSGYSKFCETFILTIIFCTFLILETKQILACSFHRTNIWFILTFKVYETTLLKSVFDVS